MIESCVLGPKTGPERWAGYQTNILPTTVHSRGAACHYVGGECDAAQISFRRGLKGACHYIGRVRYCPYQLQNGAQGCMLLYQKRVRYRPYQLQKGAQRCPPSYLKRMRHCPYWLWKEALGCLPFRQKRVRCYPSGHPQDQAHCWQSHLYNGNQDDA